MPAAPASMANTRHLLRFFADIVAVYVARFRKPETALRTSEIALNSPIPRGVAARDDSVSNRLAVRRGGVDQQKQTRRLAACRLQPL